MSPDVPTRASVAGAFVDGWRRVFRAPWLVAGVLFGICVIEVPVATSFGIVTGGRPFLAGALYRPMPGWSGDWIAAGSAPLRQWTWIFAHDVFGFDGIVPIVRGFLGWSVGVIPWIGTNAVLWAVLGGGALDRLARARPVGTAAFSAACGVYFVRFLRLGIWLGAAYWILFRLVFPSLLRMAPDMTPSGGIGTRGWLSVLCVALVAIVNLAGDYASVRAVVEDRRSMTAALGASMRFLRRRPWRVLALYALNLAVVLGALTVWAWVHPTRPDAAWQIALLGLVTAGLQVLARLGFMATSIALFQSDLAHAGYTAAPPLVWPDSPAAEAIDNLVRQRVAPPGQRLL